MKIKHPFLATSLLAPLAAAAATAAAAAAPLPNLVFVLVDDAGFGSWPNAEIQTPAVDALAAEGLHVPEFFVYQFCSPSRGAFLTGRYPWRLPNTRMNLIPSYILDGSKYPARALRLPPSSPRAWRRTRARCWRRWA